MLRNRRLIVALLAVVVVFATAAAYLAKPGDLSVTFLDVGEGLSVVMRTPSGKTIVYDCGTDSWKDASMVGDRVTAKYLRSLGVNRIDLAILSHPHADHVSGYASLLRRIPAINVLDIGHPDGSLFYDAFLREVKRSKAKYRIGSAGDRVTLKDGVQLIILHPARGKEYANLNEASMVVKVTYKHASFLLTGDATMESESEILGRSASVRAQVLQVGHQGSAAASSEQWLARVKPKVAVVSCGRGNRYGHPSPKTLARLEEVDARVYRTDLDGAVTISTDGEKLRVRTYRKRTRTNATD